MSGRVEPRDHPAEPGPWRWRCGNANDLWHRYVDDQGWAQTREEAEALLIEHHRREHTPERALRWSVESLDPGEWWAWGPGRTFRHSPFRTWREALDYATTAARTGPGRDEPARTPPSDTRVIPGRETAREGLRR